MFFFKKVSAEELGERPLDRKGRKEGKALIKGIRKFLRYNDDLIADKSKESIAEKRTAFSKALSDRSSKRKDLEKLAEDLTETCKKSVKDHKASAWKENIEIIFVAVVIAMGIRAYFIQQFKIPTGSMQPTLNGIIAYPTEDMNPLSERHAPSGYERPSFPQRLWDKFWFGRSHVDWVVDDDDILILKPENLYSKTHLLFFPRTYLVTENGQKFSAPGTQSRVEMLLNRNLQRVPGRSLVFSVEKGQTIAKGYVDTGDQLVVNKFAYHWVLPKRDDIYVFNTQGIPGIQRNLLNEERRNGISPSWATEPRQGSQHYIKRLVGEPGDTIEILGPGFLINGEAPSEAGILRVMAQEGYYTGYVRRGMSKVTLPEGKFWALGDNSANSSDSRDWGTVPQQDIVGRAAFVYYPFGHHFGPID
ncbi:MAG: signal peptidase I [Verrucomicrobiales bacterium]|nr:signal peptidase I [Verrucomicrobiales bacterium]|tara:strand:- start:19870 stop:21123 length:1254 start_codon:yes stop_codon:yes gene_type:complete